VNSFQPPTVSSLVTVEDGNLGSHTTTYTVVRKGEKKGKKKAKQHPNGWKISFQQMLLKRQRAVNLLH